MIYPNTPLTHREKEMQRLISKKYANPEIARKLSLSIHTVTSHGKSTMRKLQARNTAGTIYKFFEY